MQAERTDMNTIDKFNSHIMGSYGRLNVVLDKGEDDKAVDENGKTYIDFGSGIGTNSLGYCNKEWADAVCEQVRSIQHTSNYYYTKVQAEFAERLSEAAGMKNMFLCNSKCSIVIFNSKFKVHIACPNFEYFFRLINNISRCRIKYKCHTFITISYNRKFCLSSVNKCILCIFILAFTIFFATLFTIV